MMSTRRFCRLTLSALLVLLVVVSGLPRLQVPVASAANGDWIHRTYFQARCSSGLGVGIAFDGEYLWFSCYRSNPDLYKARTLDGAIVASYNVASGLGALAWDGNRKMLWAGWGAGAGAEGDVRLINPATGAATVRFNAADARMCGLDDGLAYDAQDDTLYISPDCSRVIHHYSTGGSHLNDFAWGGTGCYNSGIAIGGELMYQGSNGCNRVWVVRRSDHSPVFNFATNIPGDTNYRDEDLECDSVTFSPRTVMWSIEAYEPRRAVAFEVPPGTCATGGGVDTDGDGLLDEWEQNGVTIDPDGNGPIPPQFIDLQAMGADIRKPDIFLHIDWMEDAGHSHKLRQDAVRKVAEAFASSSYVSPTGSVGINLHVDQGPDSILDFTTGATWGALSQARSLTHVNNLGTSGGGYNWSAFQTIKDEPGGFTESGRTPIFHYVISAHNYDSTTSSGISRGIGASDLIVSLGSFTGGVGSMAEQAGTLMHELGHNLSLRHGGSDNVNFKPNYLSVMNYAFQLGGLIQGGVEGTLDYSRMTLGNLDEANLDEAPGLGAGAAGYGTRSYCPGLGYRAIADANAPIDWNCDGAATDAGISYNVNNSGGAVEVLTSYDDWANIQFKGGAIGLAGVNPNLPVETELDLLTSELADEIPPLRPCTPQPSLVWALPLSPAAPTDLAAGDTLPIRFNWGSCNGFVLNDTVQIVIRNQADSRYPVAAYVLGADITMHAASGEYGQDFVPSQFGVAAGTDLQVEVYMNYQKVGEAAVHITP